MEIDDLRRIMWIHESPAALTFMCSRLTNRDQSRPNPGSDP